MAARAPGSGRRRRGRPAAPAVAPVARPGGTAYRDPADARSGAVAIRRPPSDVGVGRYGLRERRARRGAPIPSRRIIMDPSVDEWVEQLRHTEQVQVTLPTPKRRRMRTYDRENNFYMVPDDVLNFLYENDYVDDNDQIKIMPLLYFFEHVDFSEPVRIYHQGDRLDVAQREDFIANEVKRLFRPLRQVNNPDIFP